MAVGNKTTLQEDTRTPIDGSEFVRLATNGANWKAQLTSIVGTLGASPGGSGTQLQYRLSGTAFGGMAGSSWDNATLALVLAGASIKASRFALDGGAINAQTGTLYTLLSSDNGKVITLTNASPIALTCPSGLGVAFACTIIQKGAGQVTISAGGGATVNSYSGLNKLSGQYAMGTIIADVADAFVLGGQLSP